MFYLHILREIMRKRKIAEEEKEIEASYLPIYLKNPP